MKKNILIVGATNIDLVASAYNKIKLYDKNPGLAKYNYGGVARNICENLSRLNINPTFVTIIGNDEFGKGAIRHLESLNTITIYKTSTTPTSTFISILDNQNDNYISISSMEIVKELDEAFLSTIDYTQYDLIVADANSEDVVKYLAQKGIELFIDATSDAKAKNILAIIDKITYLKCTKSELEVIFNSTSIENIITMFPNLTLIVTSKDLPIIYNEGPKIYEYTIKKRDVVNAIGAGDSFSAGFVYGLSNNYSIDKCIEIAAKIASETIQVEETVNPNLNEELIN